jgi:hypothetical protein
MDPVLTQIIITGLAGAIVTLAGIIYKMQNDVIAKQAKRIEEQDKLQEATTRTLQTVVDVGMERLRAQPPPEQTP